MMPTDRLLQLLEMLEESPGDPFLLFAAAKEYELLEDPEQALDYYRLLLDTEPDYVGLYYHLGKLLEKEGQTAAALEIYQKGMEIAAAQQDRHAYNELAGAKLNLELE
jgi:tetratricopeptide (TPR) repeat protein